MQLIYTPDTVHTFTGWTGVCGGQGPTCSVRLQQNETVSVSFTIKEPILTVTLSGGGSLAKVDLGGGVVCTGSSTCTRRFSFGATVTIEASPCSTCRLRQPVFNHWEGACSGDEDESCRLTMQDDVSVTAVFAPL